MRRILSTLLVLLVSLTISAQSMKMVVDARGNVVGRLVRTNANTYTVEVQDTYDVPKAGNKLVTFSAANGQGICYRHPERRGNINVRKGPSTNAAIVAKIPDDGDMPECYPCLGIVNGWYKIRINGKIGYIRQDMANWDGMCTF
jgi:uncharacterized protein YraI